MFRVFISSYVGVLPNRTLKTELSNRVNLFNEQFIKIFEKIFNLADDLLHIDGFTQSFSSQ